MLLNTPCTKFDFTNGLNIYDYYKTQVKEALENYKIKIKNSFFDFVKN